MCVGSIWPSRSSSLVFSGGGAADDRAEAAFEEGLKNQEPFFSDVGAMTIRKQELFVRLLQYALGIIDEPPSGLSADDWRCLYDMAGKQAVSGILFEGIAGLPQSAAPETGLLMRWFKQRERIRRHNMVMNIATVNVYQKICERGSRCCILKGQGNSVMYAHPYARTSGDIDVWIPDTRKNIRRLVSDLAEDNGTVGEEIYHHIRLSLGNIPVELHPTPALFCNFVYNHRLQQWFNRNADLQCGNMVDLPDGIGRIAAPTALFNAVYQLCHLFHHYCFEGVGLRQFVDYYYVLTNIDMMESREVLLRDLKYLGLCRFAGAVMYVMQRIFAMPACRLIVPADATRGKRLLNEVFSGGNFGSYNPDAGHKRGAFAHNFHRLQRDLRLLNDYPGECLSEPLFRLWHYFWRKKYN